MTISEKAVREAAFWEETICPACGDTGGEKFFECFECEKATVLPAKLVVEVLENVEREEADDGS